MCFIVALLDFKGIVKTTIALMAKREKGAKSDHNENEPYTGTPALQTERSIGKFVVQSNIEHLGHDPILFMILFLSQERNFIPYGTMSQEIFGPEQ